MESNENLKNEYVYLIYELYVDDDVACFEPICVTSNIIEFLEILVNMPIFTEVIVSIISSGDQQLKTVNNKPFNYTYEYYSYVSKRDVLYELMKRLSLTKKYNCIDNITRNTIITYIGEYIDNTDFDELERIENEYRDARVRENKINQLNKLAKELGYELVKEEEKTWG